MLASLEFDVLDDDAVQLQTDPNEISGLQASGPRPEPRQTQENPPITSSTGLPMTTEG